MEKEEGIESKETQAIQDKFKVQSQHLHHRFNSSQSDVTVDIYNWNVIKSYALRTPLLTKIVVLKRKIHIS